MERSFSFYDKAMNVIEKGTLRKARRDLVSKAHGKVLEIGSGTGINFPFYQNVEQVDAIEPNESSLKVAQSKANQAGVPIFLHQQSAENLPFADHTFDSVVATLVFCTISDPQKAIKEMRRVSKEDATFLFYEHVRMDHPFLGTMQDVINPVWKRLFHNCHLNRDTSTLLKESGFVVNKLQSYYRGLFLVMECSMK